MDNLDSIKHILSFPEQYDISPLTEALQYVVSECQTIILKLTNDSREEIMNLMAEYLLIIWFPLKHPSIVLETRIVTQDLAYNTRPNKGIFHLINKLHRTFIYFHKEDLVSRNWVYLLMLIITCDLCYYSHNVEEGELINIIMYSHSFTFTNHELALHMYKLLWNCSRLYPYILSKLVLAEQIVLLSPDFLHEYSMIEIAQNITYSNRSFAIMVEYVSNNKEMLLYSKDLQIVNAITKSDYGSLSVLLPHRDVLDPFFRYIRKYAVSGNECYKYLHPPENEVLESSEEEN